MLKLKLQYFSHLMRRTDSLEKTLMLEKIEGGRRRRWMKWLDGITDMMDMSLSRLQELMMGREAWLCCSPWGRKELDTNEGLNQTDLKDSIFFCKMIYLALFLINNYNAILHSQFT